MSPVSPKRATPAWLIQIQNARSVEDLARLPIPSPSQGRLGQSGLQAFADTLSGLPQSRGAAVLAYLRDRNPILFQDVSRALAQAFPSESSKLMGLSQIDHVHWMDGTGSFSDHPSGLQLSAFLFSLDERQGVGTFGGSRGVYPYRNQDFPVLIRGMLLVATEDGSEMHGDLELRADGPPAQQAGSAPQEGALGMAGLRRLAQEVSELGPQILHQSLSGPQWMQTFHALGFELQEMNHGVYVFKDASQSEWRVSMRQEGELLRPAGFYRSFPARFAGAGEAQLEFSVKANGRMTIELTPSEGNPALPEYQDFSSIEEMFAYMEGRLPPSP